jgi:hypothetical protein
METEGGRTPGIFTACRYFWRYFATAPATGMEIVPVTALAGAQQCHAVLDDTADVDGDPVPGSNSTFQFVGASADQPELLLIRRCALCRQPESISVGYAACPLMSQVGKWRQSTVHSTTNVANQRTIQLKKIDVFAQEIKNDALYAVFASALERGGRYYWLLRTLSSG